MGSTKRKFAFGAVLVAALVALTGCGSSSSSSSSSDNSNTSTASESSMSTTSNSPQEWAAGFCTDAKAWRQSLQQAKTTLKNGSASNTTTALNTAKNATLEFRGQLERLGTPPTPQGTQAQQTVQSYAGQLQVDYQTLQGEYQQSSSGASQTAKKAQSIALTLKSMVMTLQRAYTQLTTAAADGSELGDALKSNSDCQTAFPNA